MARKKSNDLKLSEIKREAKSLDKKETIELGNGKDLHFYPIFLESIIDNLLIEFQENIKYASEKEIEITDKLIHDYTLFLCIKHFTHLKKDIPNEFDQQVQAMKWLTDTGLFREIVEDVFDKKEISKVWDRITSFLAISQYSEKLMEDVQKKIKNIELENKDIIEDVLKNRNLGIRNSVIEEKINEVIN